MTTVTVRELRSNGGEVIDRVLGGDTVVVTRDGHEVAELRPLRPRPLDAATLLSRWRHLPVVGPGRFRHDVRLGAGCVSVTDVAEMVPNPAICVLLE
jgi:antitoxin (DNA-binding transcriptional repressor) of toxin-antitoxin stability system